MLFIEQYRSATEQCVDLLQRPEEELFKIIRERHVMLFYVTLQQR